MAAVLPLKTKVLRLYLNHVFFAGCRAKTFLKRFSSLRGVFHGVYCKLFEVVLSEIVTQIKFNHNLRTSRLSSDEYSQYGVQIISETSIYPGFGRKVGSFVFAILRAYYRRIA